MHIHVQIHIHIHIHIDIDVDVDIDIDIDIHIQRVRQITGSRSMAARRVRVRRRAWRATRIYELTPTSPRPLLVSLHRFALPAATTKRNT